MSDDLSHYIPAHNLEAEQAVLGAILILPSAIERVSEMIDTHDFYLPVHQIIFDAIIYIHKKREPVDLVTLQDRLISEENLAAVGGMRYLTGLFDSVASAGNVEYYAKILQEKTVQRQLVERAMEVIDLARSSEIDSVESLIERAHKKILTVQPRIAEKDDWIPLERAMDEKLDEWEEAFRNPGQIVGLRTGYDKLDMLIGGMKRGKLIYIAGRPSMGKSSLAIDIAVNVAMRQNVSVGIVSIETTPGDIAAQVYSQACHINSKLMDMGESSNADFDLLVKTRVDFGGVPLYIDGSADFNMNRLLQRLRRKVQRTGVGLIVVDHLGLIENDNKESKRLEIAGISRALKTLAVSENIPVIALSQLSRGVESRDNKRPKLSDLAESGNLEADADIIMMLYREAYYSDNPPAPNVPQDVEILVRKGRSSGTGMVKLSFIPEYAAFVPLDRFHAEGDF